MKKSKHFALLAHADDNRGFLRNTMGFYVSKTLGMPWTPEQRPVEVVLNGDYIGLYFLTETIRVDKDRVNVVEQPDLATGAEEITGGWLVEIDNYDTDPHVTVKEGGDTNYNIIFTYKTPEELSAEQEKYLTDQMTNLNTKIYSNAFEACPWQSYIDLETLAKFYLTQEIVANYESFHGSCYLSKQQGATEKWMFGPVWDFGSALFPMSDQFFISTDRYYHQVWIGQMCKYPPFINIVKEDMAGFLRQLLFGNARICRVVCRINQGRGSSRRQTLAAVWQPRRDGPMRRRAVVASHSLHMASQAVGRHQPRRCVCNCILCRL